ncbi:MAG: SGNH/GDSL hydrolase family protein [Lachnospiraceae bacterium]|nr:SGNH/GDSL hydrolase family protein [Lachnospiraceae bacterium]
MKSIKEQFPAIKVLGRTSKENPYVLFWTGSRYEFGAKAANLSVVLKASFSTFEQWITVLYDGVPLIRMPLCQGENVIQILRNRNPETLHNIRIIKESPVMPGDGEPYIELTDIMTDGTIEAVPEKKRKLLFIGDSITSGEGAKGARTEEDWVPALFSAVDNYAYMTAERLGADYQSLSQSGWGLLCGYDNDLRHNMPDTFKEVCSIAYGDGAKREVRGAEQPYDFSRFIPDVVILNLGTNDGNGLTMPAFTSPATGETFKMEAGEKELLSEASKRRFIEKAVAFLSDIRCAYPAAEICWCYGMLGNPMKPVIMEALKTYRGFTNDAAVRYIDLPEASGDSFGARWHPGKRCHEKAAETIANTLEPYFCTLGR